MKRINYLLLIVFAISLFSCKSKKDVAKVTQSTEIKTPFNGRQYETDKNYFRAISSGTSSNLNTAKEISMMNARSEISYSVKTVTKNVSDIYTRQIAGDYEDDFNKLTRQISKEILTNVKVSDYKIFRNEKNGDYTYWVVVEVSKKDVIDDVDNQIKKENIEFDKYRYEKIFDKEMEEFKNSKKVSN